MGYKYKKSIVSASNLEQLKYISSIKSFAEIY